MEWNGAEMMNPKNTFKVVGEFGVFHPTGKVTLTDAITMVTEAIALARTQRVKRLMVNVHGLTGFPSPSLPERYFMAQRFAEAAQGAVRVVFVVPEHMIDPEKFGVMVARNAGMDADVFPTEPEAMTWLLKP